VATREWTQTGQGRRGEKRSPQSCDGEMVMSVIQMREWEGALIGIRDSKSIPTHDNLRRMLTLLMLFYTLILILLQIWLMLGLGSVSPEPCLPIQATRSTRSKARAGVRVIPRPLICPPRRRICTKPRVGSKARIASNPCPDIAKEAAPRATRIAETKPYSGTSHLIERPTCDAPIDGDPKKKGRRKERESAQTTLQNGKPIM
jgi:hypothetical protein